MEASIWSATLTEFRDSVGGEHPVPAGVAISAVSASLALALLSKVLRITGARKDFAGDPQEIEALYQAARSQSSELTDLADQDVRAFTRYLESMHLPEDSGRERAMAAAMLEATKVPLDAARLAIQGFALCAHSARLCSQGMTASDLGMAKALLFGAARAMLLSVESNLQHLPPDEAFYTEITAELQALKKKLEA
jgi:formiminotetrahydrofolate cyclodeaminase